MRFLIGLGVLGCGSDKSITTVNKAPEATITSHSDGDEVFEGYSITLRGSASDSNSSYDELTATWYAGTEVICEATIPENDGTTECEVTIGVADTTFVLEVKDAQNATGATSVELVVIPTESPDALIVHPLSGGVYYSDQLITFEGILLDAEDNSEELVGYWESNVDGVLEDVEAIPNSDGEIIGYAILNEGQHAIELHVEDSTGKTGIESVIVNVGPPNSSPLCEIISPINGSVSSQGETINFEGVASDMDVSSDWLSVIWSSDKDGEIGTSIPTSSGDISFSYAALSVNSHNIMMTVLDEVGATCTTGINYTIGTPPSITIDSPVNGEIYSEGSSLDFMATISDAQDQADEVSIDWTLNGTSVSSQGATSSGIAQYLDGSLSYGSYNLVVIATDTDSLTDSDQLSFTINGLPTAPMLSLNPDPASTSDGLTANIDTPSIDPEGTTVSYSYEWQLNNVVQFSYTASTIPSSATNKGDEWRVGVTPNDGIADGFIGEVSIIIQNTGPSMSAVSILPSGATFNDDTLTCSATIIDPDEIPNISYEWSISGSIIGNASTLDLTTTGIMPDDVLLCTITATDSDGVMATDSITRMIDNRAPTLSVLISTNGTTNTGELTCTATTSDVDDFPISPIVSYEWFNAGGSLGITDQLQLDPNIGVDGDSIDCVVTAMDLSGVAVTDTASHIITNTPPAIASISLSPSSIAANTQSVTCNVTSSDVDGDSVTEGFEWYVDGVLQPEVTNMFTGPFLTGTLIACQATPNDGKIDGAFAEDMALVENTVPSLSSVMITPDPATVEDDLTCTALATDVDGDAIVYSYVWSDSNGVQQTTVEVPDTSDLFLASGLSADTWTCEVTPFDGTDYGILASDDIVVEAECSSLQFDGQGDYISNNSFQFSNNGSMFTVSLWLKLGSNMLNSSSNPTHGGIIGQWNDPNDSGWLLYYRKHHSDVGLSFFNGGDTYDQSWNPLPNTWYHVAIVKDGVQKIIYLNGQVLISSSNGTTNVPNYPLELGHIANDTGYNGSFEGLISTVDIWEAVLSPGNIQDIYNLGPSSVNIPPVLSYTTGLSNVIDSSGNGHDGMLNGATWVNSCPEE